MTARQPSRRDGRGRSNLTPEQRTERARRAANARWSAQEASDRAETTIQAQHEDSVNLLGDTLHAMTGLASQGFDLASYVPARYRERFFEATDSNDRLNNSQQISLIDLRISMLLERIDTAESGARWQECRAAMREFTVAMQSGEPSQVSAALTALNASINRGVNDYHNWQEIFDSIEVRRRVTETEVRRIKAAEEFISTSEAFEIITLIAESVNRHVQDANAKALIQADIEAAIGAAGT